MSTETLEEMTKSQQRIAIAKDVLEQIYVGRIKATPGDYLTTLRTSDRPRPKAKCRACALGALFVSKFELFGGEWNEPFLFNEEFSDFHLTLSPYFTQTQLGEIERAFEGTWNYISNDEDRMIAIMQNIIDNNGTFETSVEYEMV